MKGYSVYRDSGIDWIGEIPDHWQTRKLKRVLDLITEKSFDDTLPKIGLENIESWSGKYLETGSDFMGDGIAFLPNDILFGKLRPYLAKVLRSDFAGSAVGDIFVFRPKSEIDARFAAYRLLSYEFIDVVNGSTHGAKMPRASSEFMGELRFAFPEREEQVAIADYLDRKSAEITKLITKKQQLIDLLREERTALINHAVTQGLNPDVPRKPSGIEWLGDIPEHWEIVPLRRFDVLVQTGPFGSQLHFSDYVKGGFPIVNPSHIADGKIIPDNKVAVSETTRQRLSRHILQADDLVLARRGEIGRIAIVTGSESGFLCGTGSILIRLNTDKITPNYLLELIQLPSLKSYLEELSVGSTMSNLNTEIVGTIPVVLPPLNEQKEIIDEIAVKTTNLEQAVTSTERQIELLQEYRTALISAAVTGKIDVRA